MRNKRRILLKKSKSNSKLNIGIVLLVGVLDKFIIISIAITMPDMGFSTKDIGQFSARSVGNSIANCLTRPDISNCIKERLLSFLEAAVQDNSTWRYNEILSFEKKSPPSISKDFQRNRGERSFSDTLAERLLHVAETRSLRLSLPNEMSRLSGISDAVDDIFVPASSKPVLLTSFAEEGTVRVFTGLVDDKIEAFSNSGQKKKKKKKDKKKDKNKIKIWYLNYKNPLKGRKKKDKDKGSAMMGGMAMMAMVAQLFLGKVLLIAGAAFIMAKIALLISVLGSLKKGSSGSSGSTTEHVYISGGGHSHESGWHRRMPDGYTKIEAHKPEHPSVSGPPTSGEEYINAGPPHSSYDAHGMPAFF